MNFYMSPKFNLVSGIICILCFLFHLYNGYNYGYNRTIVTASTITVLLGILNLFIYFKNHKN